MELRSAVKNNSKTNIFFRRKVLGKREWKVELFRKFKTAMQKMKKFGLSFEDVISSNIIA
jgi:lipopolysaccharide/colanic/teichoic acid biosynthesis glycosyltransferase